MTLDQPGKKNSKEELKLGIEQERRKFEETYLWIEKHMPVRFFDEIEKDDLVLIVHALMALNHQDFFSSINLKNAAIVLCLESPSADLEILKHYQMHGIKNYSTFVSDAPPPFEGAKAPLRIASLLFTQYAEEHGDEMHPRFTRSLSEENLTSALKLLSKAKTNDLCQYEVKRSEKWKEKKEASSVNVLFAWKGAAKYHFLYRLAKIVHRHNLVMKKVDADYITPYGRESILILSLDLHGANGKAAWEETDLKDFLQELVTLKYFEDFESIETTFADSKLLSGNQTNLLKAITYFVHQVLVHADSNIYSLSHIEEGLCRHPELTAKLIDAFETKFNPEAIDIKKHQQIKESFLGLVTNLDTGQEVNDTRRKNILNQGMNFVSYTLKTNFYLSNKSAFSFRLDPYYLDQAPYERKEKFPELPYAIFFMKGMDFIGFHLRFKDLSRGGLRTVVLEKSEQILLERNQLFSECYGLAYTQQKKNKDIPEGGAKGVIFLEPSKWLGPEMEIYKNELLQAGIPQEECEQRLADYFKEQKSEHLFQAQRSYVKSLVTLVNCEDDGTLKTKEVVDYWKKPEYIYLGPDENMSNEMIVWISNYSVATAYKPGSCFISSKPGAGINHKEYGVTSLGVNVYMEEVLKFLGIDPLTEPFTIKMSGGPDGDVAGNQILNLYYHHPKTAKLLALIDVSGTIFDPEGLDLQALEQLFKESKSIRFYPPEKLHEGGFLLDLEVKREQQAYAKQTLCWRKKEGALIQDWLTGNEMNHLLRHNVLKTRTDIFIPGGGRPRTLGDSNFIDFLDETGVPSSRAIVEGANLYLTPWARRSLEKLGVIIIKDSSANKGGVICSSFEILCGLVLSEQEFIEHKPTLMKEILDIIRARAKDEAQLLLHTHVQTGAYLTDISEWVSERINIFMYQLLDYLQPLELASNPKDPLTRCLLNYSPPLLRARYSDRLLTKIPDLHKKAIIACHIASRLVYKRGLDWSPTIVDILPLIAHDPDIIGDF